MNRIGLNPLLICMIDLSNPNFAVDQQGSIEAVSTPLSVYSASFGVLITLYTIPVANYTNKHCMSLIVFNKIFQKIS